MTYWDIRKFIQASGIICWALIAATSFAQHGEAKKTETFAAPKACGVVGVCNGGEKIFMYSCQGDNVSIRLCGPGSNYRPESQNYCQGPEKTVPKTRFRLFIRNQISKQGLQGNLGPISKADVELVERDENLDLYEARDCQKDIENKISMLRNKLSQLEGAISQVVKIDIEAQIKTLETELQKAQAKVATCLNRDAALKKINTEIETAMTTICARDGVHIPKMGSFMHSVLSQYDPSKHPCTTEANCAEEVKLKNGSAVGSVVARHVNEAGEVEEFVKDKASRLTWSPETKTGGPKNNGEMSWAEAKLYCESKKDLGLRWGLPNKEDFRVAFNASNPDKKKFSANPNFREGLEGTTASLWSSSEVNRIYAWRFQQDKTALAYGLQGTAAPVRCVGR